MVSCHTLSQYTRGLLKLTSKGYLGTTGGANSVFNCSDRHLIMLRLTMRSIG